MSDSVFDVVIVGAGPAGCAAAIATAKAGMRTLIVERRRGVSSRPGETMAPGLETVFRELGVLERVERAASIRPRGVQVAWGDQTQRFQSFGPQDADWLGYQVPRAQLDALLLEHARELGVTLLTDSVRRVLALAGRVTGIELPSQRIEAAFVVDATGSRRLLANALRLPQHSASRKLIARYGYVTGTLPSTQPSLCGGRDEWTWIAQVAPQRIAWVRLGLTRPAPLTVPQELMQLTAAGRARSEDVTWSHVPMSAGPGYFLVGDAASRLDPASAHGVLKALMTGYRAGHAIVASMQGRVSEALASQDYRRWLAAWFEHDRVRLNELYAQLSAA